MDNENKYNNALKKLQEALAPKDGCKISGLTRGCIEEIFPELAESEDERIRKEIISALKWANHKGVYDKHIAWLEKQGEQKLIDKVRHKFHEGDWVVNNTTLNSCHILKVEHGQYICDDCSFPITKENEYHIWTIQDAKDGDILSDGNMILIFKHFEEPAYRENIVAYIGLDSIGHIQVTDYTWQLGTDREHPATKEQRELLFQKMKKAGYMFDFEKKELKKIEPKFKIGNWYQCTKDFFGKGVTFDKNTAYYCAKEGCLQNEYGCHIAIVKDLYDNFKLWTIEDAKNGDVLYSLDSNQPFIYKERNIHEQATAYCGINKYGKFFVWNTKDCIITLDKYVPATKSQCDALMSAMADAGYEWDAEKKELKKIGQKQAIDYIDSLIDSHPKDNWELVHKFVEKFGRIPEDEDELNVLVEYVLKRQKPAEWSEEDEEKFRDVIRLIEQGAPVQSIRDHYTNWLKSLKDRVQPQKQWKPSEEQIKTCKEVYADILSAKGFDLGTVNNELNRLEEQLKKLK